MNEELKVALSEMAKGLEGKTAEQIKTELKSFEEKYEALTKSDELTKSELKMMKEAVELDLKAIQDHVNKLDVKLKESKRMEVRKGDALKSVITENFESIKGVRTGKPVEVKAVGDMTLTASLTGDQPRDYSSTVAAVPAQLVNVSDLIQSISISGGTYTFPRETGSEGSISSQTEGSSKSQIDYDLTMVDVNTNFIAGFAVYSKKMANNLPFLESFLPQALRRDYWKAENSIFNTALAAGVTASSEVITGKNKVEMLVNEIATLEGLNFAPNVIVVKPADWYSIMVTEKSTGAGYGLPGIVQYNNGMLSINGVQVVKANWLAANKYYVGDFSRIKKVNTDGLALEFFEQDSDNVRKNNITARIEAQTAIAIERTDAVIYGDFTAV